MAKKQKRALLAAEIAQLCTNKGITVLVIIFRLHLINGVRHMLILWIT